MVIWEQGEHLEETKAGEYNYPGTYVAGLYNRLTSKVGDRDIENEDFVNIPNWLPIQFKIGNEDWIDINKTEILDIERNLDFRTGVLYRKLQLKIIQVEKYIIKSEADCQYGKSSFGRYGI